MKTVILALMLASCSFHARVNVTFGQKVRVTQGFYASCEGTAVDERNSGSSIIVRITSCHGESKDFEIELRQGEFITI